MLLENVDTIKRPGAFSKISLIAEITLRSDGVYPSISALVESDKSKSTPSVPNRAILPRLISAPTGVKSILKSPVVTTRPSGVSIQIPKQSGIEWVMLKKDNLNSLMFKIVSSSYSTILTGSLMR